MKADRGRHGMAWQVGGGCSRCLLVYLPILLEAAKLVSLQRAGIFSYRCNGTSPRSGHSVGEWHWYFTTVPCREAAREVCLMVLRGHPIRGRSGARIMNFSRLERIPIGGGRVQSELRTHQSGRDV
ncbi:hypothetical protein LY78DRAFT_141519 [Colletotrichum sublineola]|nr:hypothetical protein LY78DRAFT_141519 [Colletotrichum sublineola]